MQGDCVPGLDGAKEVFVILDPKLWVMTTLEHDLGRTLGNSLVDPLENVLHGTAVSLRGTGQPIEGAERTLDNADVRVVDVPVNDEGGPVVGEPAEA